MSAEPVRELLGARPVLTSHAEGSDTVASSCRFRSGSLAAVVAASMLVGFSGSPALGQSVSSLNHDSTAFDVEIAPDECRAGGRVSKLPSTSPCSWTSPTTFDLAWLDNELRLTVGATTIVHVARWPSSEWLRIAAIGRARVTVTSVDGRPTSKTLAGTAGSNELRNLVLTSGRGSDGWKLTGTVERRDGGSPIDAVLFDLERRDDLWNRETNWSTSAAVAGPYVTPRTSRKPRLGAGRALTWTGSASALWSNPANWSPAGPPNSFDVLIFDRLGSYGQSMNNDIPGLVVGGITAQNDNNFLIGGFGLTLQAGASSTIGRDFKVSSLAGSGTINMTGGKLFVAQDSNTTFSGTITGGQRVLKQGTGTLTLTGASPSLAALEVDAGLVILDSGTVGQVEVKRGRFAILNNGKAGNVYPDDSEFGLPGVVGVGSSNDLRINNGNYYETIAGETNYSKLSVTGSVQPGRAQLNVQLAGGYVPAVGTVFVIIDNDGGDGVNIPFKGPGGDLNEGARFVANDVEFQITYQYPNGTGNDVALIVTRAPGPTLVPNLTIAKSHFGNFPAGESGTYTIAVSNSGTGPTIAAVSVSDPLPTGLTPTAASGAGWSCSLNGQIVACNRADALAAGQKYPDITIVVRVAPSTSVSTVTNTATVSGGGETNTSDNQASDPTTIEPPAVVTVIDLQIAKVAQGTFSQGGQAQYALTVSNAASSTVSTTGAVTVTDTLPEQLASPAASGVGWQCTANGRTVTCTRSDSLSPGSSYPPISITAAIAGDAPYSVVNAAAVAGGGDTVGGNNTVTITSPVSAVAPRLTIDKTHSGDFTQGQAGATFTLTVTNAGNGATPASTATTVTDTPPAGLTPTEATGAGWDCRVTGRDVSCSRNDSLGAGASFAPITLRVNVAADAQNGTNVSTVSHAGATSTDSDPYRVSGAPTSPNLTIEKAHSGDFTIGQTDATFTLRVTNAGTGPTSDAVSTRVADAIPAGLTPTSAAGAGWNCSIASQNVECTRNGVLTAGTEYPPITLRVTVNAGAVSGTNTATVSYGSQTNTDDDAYNVGGVPTQPNLNISKTHSGVFVPGQTDAAFIITVGNTGSAPTTGTVAVADSVPAGLVPTSATGQGWSCQTTGQDVRCTRDDALAPGTSFPAITLRMSVNPGAPSGVNVATATNNGNTRNASDSYTVAGSPDLVLTKSHTGNFTLGQAGATFSLVVRNAGAAPTSGEVVVDDPVPPGLTPTAASGDGWACTVQGQSVSCRRGDALAAGQSWPTISLAVSVTSLPGTVNNVANVSGGGDGSPGNNTAVDPTIIAGRPQLTIQKTHTGPVVQGESGLQFTIQVFNNGTADTTGAVTVTDSLPVGLVPVDVLADGWACTTAGVTVTCTRADALAPGASWPPIYLTTNVGADAVSVTNVVSVAGGGDTTPNDNTASDLVPIAPPGQPNLTLSKTRSGDIVPGPRGANYLIRVGNLGQAVSAGAVTVRDDLPSGMTPVAVSGDGWNCGIAGQAATCRRDDSLTVGDYWPPITIVADVAAGQAAAVNSATVSGGGDQTPADNTGTDNSNIEARIADLTIAKNHDDPFVSGQQGAAYRVTVSNIGNGETSGEVLVTDSIPGGMTPVSASGSGWSCGIAARVVTCRRSDTLPPGASFPQLTLLVNVAPTASSVANLVTVSGGGDGRADNNAATDFTNVNLTADPTISLTLTTPLLLGSDADYVAVVTNLGPGRVGGVIRVDTDLPQGLLPVLGVGSGWACTIEGQRVRCSHVGGLDANASFPALTVRGHVNIGSGVLTVGTVVVADADSNAANNHAEVSTPAGLPAVGLSIVKTASVDQVTIGGRVTYRLEVANAGDIRLDSVVVRDVPPRGFTHVESGFVRFSRRSTSASAPTPDGDALVWVLGALQARETVVLTYHVVVGADARSGPQQNRATVEGGGPLGRSITAGPAIATVNVTGETFTMLQALVGRVYEDVDGDGAFTGADRPVPNARIITSTGQAAISDPAGLYNIPSLGAGSVAVSLDRDTIPGQLTVGDGGPGVRSWTRLIRTPVGGGTLLRQNFALRRAEGAKADTPPAVAVVAPPPSPSLETMPEAAAGALPPRREYEPREGSSLLIALGEISFGPAAPELGLFSQDDDVWGYGSIFYQGGLLSPRNRLTLAYDSHRRLNNTTDRQRLFELDANDRAYPVFGDSSQRQEFATSNAKIFARLERGNSHVMYGDLIGDLPTSATDGGRWSSYQRHLTGGEFRLADAAGNHVTVRAAQPTTAYARDTFAGTALGLVALTYTNVLPGTETIAVETRDRRSPERVIAREVLARGVDYQLEASSGSVFLIRRVSGLDSALNLMQIVATYEHEIAGLDNMLFSGRAQRTLGGVRLGGTFFTEEGLGAARFSVAGVDAEGKLPGGGRFRAELPYSHGTPDVVRTVDYSPVNDSGDGDGLSARIEVEQPVGLWRGTLSGSFLRADQNFRNPFSSTITPGSQYANAGGEFQPRASSRLAVGVTDERYDTARVDASRTSVSAAWSETIARHVTVTAGYDARHLDQAGATTDSGLLTAGVAVKAGSRVEGRVAREENVRDADDPTYPDQTTLGAKVRLGGATNLFYTQRISDSAIVPVGDYAGTGFASLPTKGELNLGVESRVSNTTQVTSRYQIQNGINGADAFAVIGASTQIGLGRGFSSSVGAEHGVLVSGDGSDYTSGTVGLAWLGSDRFKATTRYEANERDGYAGLLSAGLAARIHRGLTGLVRTQWLDSSQRLSVANSLTVLGAVALRPVGSDRVGVLLSYQYNDRDAVLTTFGARTDGSAWRQRMSTDGYVQALPWLALHGKFGWEQVPVVEGDPVDTYLAQGRAQFTLFRFLDAALEERYIRQPLTDSTRRSTGTEVGFWPMADLRLAVGYHFQDTRDPYGRDLQGSDEGVYAAISTKLSKLFNLMGTAPPR